MLLAFPEILKSRANVSCNFLNCGTIVSALSTIVRFFFEHNIWFHIKLQKSSRTIVRGSSTRCISNSGLSGKTKVSQPTPIDFAILP